MLESDSTISNFGENLISSSFIQSTALLRRGDLAEGVVVEGIDNSRTDFLKNILVNGEIILDKKSVIAGISQDHTLFKSIEVTDDYAHTNYFNNGQVWTNHWFTLTFVGNFTGETTSTRAHTDLKWENGKVVRFQVYYDPTFQIKEATAMSEMSK